MVERKQVDAWVTRSAACCDRRGRPAQPGAQAFLEDQPIGVGAGTTIGTAATSD
ncbi:MAG: hypothetical protein R3B49_07860 [Phycisphaerales bacterium]